jgi:hypothetical protein
MTWAVRSCEAKGLVERDTADEARRALRRWARGAGVVVGRVWAVPASALTPSQLEGLEVLS